MYDVIEIIKNLNEEHDNAIAVFGGAQFAYKYAHGDTMDLTEFALFLPYVANDARFFRWHEGVVGALKRFCNLCLVDPALIEAYIGMRFEEVANI